jgi:hypothetical protein
MAVRKTSIDTGKFEAITTKLGFTVKKKAGSFKAWPANGSMKKSVDVNTSKTGQTVQAILVGFEVEEGTIAHPKPPAKTVTQMIDFSLEEKLVLRSFYKACKSLASLAEVKPPVAETTVDEEVKQAVEEAAAHTSEAATA